MDFACGSGPLLAAAAAAREFWQEARPMAHWAAGAPSLKKLKENQGCVTDTCMVDRTSSTTTDSALEAGVIARPRVKHSHCQPGRKTWTAFECGTWKRQGRSSTPSDCSSGRMTLCWSTRWRS